MVPLEPRENCARGQMSPLTVGPTRDIFVPTPPPSLAPHLQMDDIRSNNLDQHVFDNLRGYVLPLVLGQRLT